MAGVGDHSAALTNGERHSGRTRVRRKSLPKPYEPLGGIRQLNRTELWQRIAEAPSRRHMQRPYPREDLRENFGRFYDWMWRSARHNRSARVDTTWGQCAIGNGYDPESVHPGAVLTSMQRYAELAAEIGVAVMGGVQDKSGAWRRCDFRLLDPDDISCREAGVAQLVKATRAGRERPSRVAVRRRESRRERHAHRHLPHRRRGGRGVAKPRYSLFFVAPNLGSPLRTSLTSSGPSSNYAAGPRAGLDARGREGPAAAVVEDALMRLRQAAITGEPLEALMLSAVAAATLAPVDVVGELLFRCLFGSEPKLSMRRRLQLRRTAGQLERTANFGIGAPPGFAAGELAKWMHGHAADLDQRRPKGNYGAPPLARPQSLGWFVVKLRRQARTWRDNERRRRGAQPAGG